MANKILKNQQSSKFPFSVMAAIKWGGRGERGGHSPLPPLGFWKVNRDMLDAPLNFWKISFPPQPHFLYASVSQGKLRALDTATEIMMILTLW